MKQQASIARHQAGPRRHEPRLRRSDIPAKLVRATARRLKLTPVEFAEAAAMLNRPFVTNHVR